jgi:uncharacterized protein (TIGR00255 family)
MIRSMTGFGTAEGRVGDLRVSVELRAVNHRFFTPTLKLPGALARWETEAREALRARVARGHVTLHARAEREVGDPGAGLAGPIIDQTRLDAYVDAYRDLHRRKAPEKLSLDFASLLRLPGVLVEGEAELPAAEGSAAELVALVDQAVGALTAMRAAEGQRLADVLHGRLAAMAEAFARIAARAPARLVEQRDRLRAAVRELAGGVALDDGRLAQEVAVLADRLDVSEEIDRFGMHVAAFRAALDDGGPEPVGKRLGFLLQEMLREVNTTGSKAADAAMLADVLLLKEELERVREQVENVE